MNAKHTPGPWEVSAPFGPGDWAVLSKHVNAGGNFYIASMPNGSHNEAKANAQLIAAAPDLLYTAMCLLSSLDDSGESGDEFGNDYHDIKPLRAAIKKALGDI